jgi:metal-dependent amidase/aminoacylase/carboxypeptidase family protein
LGCSKPGEEHGAPLHSPAFMIDEDCLKIGVLFLANVALAALEKLG